MPITMTSSRWVYENPWMALREDQITREDGSHGIYAVVEKPDFATIAAYENGGFHLIRQDRYPTGTRTWEMPQGTFDADDPETVARAELRQETGLTAGVMRHIGTVYNAPGLTSQACHVFFAAELSHGAQDLDLEEQDLEHRWFAVSEIEQMILDGRTVETVTIATLMLLRLHQVI